MLPCNEAARVHPSSSSFRDKNLANHDPGIGQRRKFRSVWPYRLPCPRIGEAVLRRCKREWPDFAGEDRPRCGTVGLRQTGWLCWQSDAGFAPPSFPCLAGKIQGISQKIGGCCAVTAQQGAKSAGFASVSLKSEQGISGEGSGAGDQRTGRGLSRNRGWPTRYKR